MVPRAIRPLWMIARFFNGSIAQLVEQRTENPCVVGSIPTGATIYYLNQMKVGEQTSITIMRQSQGIYKESTLKITLGSQ